MPSSVRHLVMVLALALPACGLSGCGSINQNITPVVVDAIPHWVGGLPADAPPRPGTAKYEEFMQERERKRLEVKPAKEDAAAASTPSASGLDAVH